MHAWFNLLLGETGPRRAVTHETRNGALSPAEPAARKKSRREQSRFCDSGRGVVDLPENKRGTIPAILIGERFNFKSFRKTSERDSASQRTKLKSLRDSPSLGAMYGFRNLALLTLLSLACGAGCDKPAPPAPPKRMIVPGMPTEAQPKLQTIKLWIGTEEVAVELALNHIQVQTGMMFRTNIAENEGMLFVFPMPHRASFWMLNTYVPLSAGYIDADGQLLEIHDLQPRNTNSVTAATDNIQYVLETKQGWFQRHHIGIGTVVRTERGSLHETFTRKR